MMTANNESRYWRERAGKPGMTESSSAPSRAISPFSALAIAVVVTLGALYIVSMFLRNSVGVIAPSAIPVSRGGPTCSAAHRSVPPSRR